MKNKVIFSLSVIVILLIITSGLYTYTNKEKFLCVEPEGRTLEKNEYAYPPKDTYGKADLCLLYTGEGYPPSDEYVFEQTPNFKIVDPTCNDALKCYVAESQCSGRNVKYKIERCPNCSRGNCSIPEYYKYFIINKDIGLDIKDSKAVYGYLNLSNYMIDYTDGSNAQVRVLQSEQDAITFFEKNSDGVKYDLQDGIRYVKFVDDTYFWQIGQYTVGVSNEKLFNLYFDKYLKELNQI